MVALNGRHIVALGGDSGKFGQTVALDDYVLSLCASEFPKVCFLGTAGGDNPEDIVGFYRAFGENGRAHCTHFSVFRRDERDPRELLLSCDAVMVGGGAVANLLELWRLHGLDEILREAWEAGVVLAGYSAGGICWFEGGVTMSFGPPPRPVSGALGFLKGCFCPHYDSVPERAQVIARAIREGALPAPGYGADEGVGFHFVGTELAEVVGAHEGARAHLLTHSADGELVVMERPAGLLTPARTPSPPDPLRSRLLHE